MAEKNLYFESSSIKFFSTGTTLLDCILGGGWAIGRICNVVGDKALGKSQLGYEACACFSKAFPDAPIWYNDIELTTDPSYLSNMGIDPEKIDLINTIDEDGEPTFRTIEAVGDDLLERADQLPANGPALYVLDSYDALSDINELDRKMSDKTYGGDKAKGFNGLLRRANQLFPSKGLTFLVISQIREEIGGVTYIKSWRRQGEKPLDFFASQILWLTPKAKLKRTVNKLEQIYGNTVKAQVRKNKCGIPWKDANIDLLHSFGVDDIGSNLKFLAEVNALNDVPGLSSEKKKDMTSFIQKIHFEMDAKERNELTSIVDTLVRKKWAEIEKGFAIPHTKF